MKYSRLRIINRVCTIYCVTYIQESKPWIEKKLEKMLQLFAH